jgi:hypothetical protein
VSRRRQTVSSRQWTVGSLLFGVVIMFWFIGRADSGSDPPAYAALRQIVQQRTKPADRVLVVATSARPAYPLLLQTGRLPGSRYLCAFPIALFYADAKSAKASRFVYRRRWEAPAEERQFLNELEEDVVRLQPRLIVVHDSAGWQGLPKGFNTLEYLVYCGWIQDAVTPYYRELPSPEGWRVFERRE